MMMMMMMDDDDDDNDPVAALPGHVMEPHSGGDP
jgi:hypothetical protein